MWWALDLEEWRRRGPQSQINGVVFSNELLDSFPVHRFGWDARHRAWFVWGVAVRDENFVWIRLEAGQSSGEETVIFFVKDEGIGIPSDEQGRIFEKFYRLDPQMTRGVGGTGLGLYICSELVHRMGGNIWVESTEGQGSTFLLELPVESAPYPRGPLPVQAQPSGAQHS